MNAERGDIASICYGGGFLVGPGLVVPVAPSTSHEMQRTAATGCNQLVCRSCSAAVRQRAGFKEGAGASDHVARIYDQPDWSSSSLLVAAADTRLYACRCTMVAISGDRWFVMPDRIWSCAGHPSAGEPPGMLDLRDVNSAVMYSPNIPYLRFDLFGPLTSEQSLPLLDNRFLFELIARKRRPKVLLNTSGLHVFGSELAFAIADWTARVAAAGARKLAVVVDEQVASLFDSFFTMWATRAAPHGLTVRAIPVSQFEQTSESIGWFD